MQAVSFAFAVEESRPDAHNRTAMRYDIRLAGVGGQGLILAGMILGEAASIYGGLNAVQTQTYAPLVRGAPSMSEVIIADGDIDFPVVEQADLLVALVQDSYDEYAGRVRAGGWIIVQDGAVVPADGSTSSCVPLPLIQAAHEAQAPPIAATMVALGVVSRLLGALPDEAMRSAIKLRVPRDSRDANLRALEAGFALAEQVLAEI